VLKWVLSAIAVPIIAAAVVIVRKYVEVAALGSSEDRLRARRLLPRLQAEVERNRKALAPVVRVIARDPSSGWKLLKDVLAMDRTVEFTAWDEFSRAALPASEQFQRVRLLGGDLYGWLANIGPLTKQAAKLESEPWWVWLGVAVVATQAPPVERQKFMEEQQKLMALPRHPTTEQKKRARQRAAELTARMALFDQMRAAIREAMDATSYVRLRKPKQS